MSVIILIIIIISSLPLLPPMTEVEVYLVDLALYVRHNTAHIIILR